jgi:hypothetical protein
MKKIAICLCVLLSIYALAQHKHHFDRKERAQKRAERTVEDLGDYVGPLNVNVRDSLTKYFTFYYGNARTYSPTASVRKKSRTVLDAQVKTMLVAPNQYKDYEVFMKDQTKRLKRMKQFDKKRKHRFGRFGKGADFKTEKEPQKDE